MLYPCTTPEPSPKASEHLSPNFTSRIYTNDKISEFRRVFLFFFFFFLSLFKVAKSSKYIEKGKMNTFHSRKMTKSNVNPFPVDVGPSTGRANWPSASLHLPFKDPTGMLYLDSRPVDIGDHLCFCCCCFGSVAAYQMPCCCLLGTHTSSLSLPWTDPHSHSTAAVRAGLLPGLPICWSTENSLEVWGHLSAPAGKLRFCPSTLTKAAGPHPPHCHRTQPTQGFAPGQAGRAAERHPCTRKYPSATERPEWTQVT